MLFVLFSSSLNGILGKLSYVLCVRHYILFTQTQSYSNFKHYLKPAYTPKSSLTMMWQLCERYISQFNSRFFNVFAKVNFSTKKCTFVFWYMAIFISITKYSVKKNSPISLVPLNRVDAIANVILYIRDHIKVWWIK